MTATAKMVVVEVRPSLVALLFLGFVVVLSHAVSQYCLSYVLVAGLARTRLGVEGCQCVWRGQTPSSGLQHSSFNHCRIYLRHRVQKTVS